MTVYTSAVKTHVRFEDIPVGAVYCWGHTELYWKNLGDHRRKISDEKGVLLDSGEIMEADDHDKGPAYSILEMPKETKVATPMSNIPKLFILRRSAGSTSWGTWSAVDQDKARDMLTQCATAHPSDTFILVTAILTAEHTVSLVDLTEQDPLKIDE